MRPQAPWYAVLAAALLLAPALVGVGSPWPEGALGVLGADGPGSPQPTDKFATLESVTDRIMVSEPGRRVSEFQMATDPTDADHLLVGVIDFSSDEGGWRCAAFTSFDGGRSWSGGLVGPLADGATSWDPWVGFGPGGEPHLMCLWRDHDSTTGIMHLTSDDGGHTWVRSGELLQRPGQDRVSFIVDAQDRVHACFATADGGHIMTSSGGAWSHWSLGTEVQVCNGIAEDPDGTLVAVVIGPGAAPGRFQAGVVTSDDGGATWGALQPGLTITLFTDPLGAEAYGRPVFSYPTMAIDPTTGTIAIAAQSQGDDGLLETVLAVSEDGGATFTERSLPPPPSACVHCHATKPIALFDDAGTLGVQTLVRNAAGAPEQKVWFVASPDAGLTWTAPFQVASATVLEGQMSPLWIGPDARPLLGDAGRALDGDIDSAVSTAQPDAYGWTITHHDGGDYWGSTVTDDGFLVTWIDAAHGGPPALWTTIVTAS